MKLRGKLRDDGPVVFGAVRDGELRLALRAPLGLIVDTGFTGALAVPEQIARRWRLDFVGVEPFALATGEIVDLPVYLGTARLGRRKIDTWFIIGDALVGMEFLQQTCSQVVLDFHRRSVELVTQ